MQLIELALPVIVAASFLGLLISAIDSRKVGPLFVAASVAAFGWVTIMGPRSAQPSPRPVDPIRIVAVTMPLSGGGAATPLKALGAPKADVEIVVTPTKKAGAAVMRTHTSSVAFQSARFVVLSRFPAHELPLPKALPSDLVLRFQVDAPTGAFVVYAVRTGAGVLESSMNDPLGMDRLLAAALHERLPVILVGDAGIGDRSTEYRTLSTSFRDALRAGTSASSTLRSAIWTPLLLRVDHLFTSRSWCAAGGGTFDVPGSDHRGVVAAVGPCPR
jgi:endonuclease/exonuclease/phosphatase family metal-dependent hydrolase